MLDVLPPLLSLMPSNDLAKFSCSPPLLDSWWTPQDEVHRNSSRRIFFHSPLMNLIHRLYHRPSLVCLLFAASAFTSHARDVFWQGGNSSAGFHAYDNWVDGIAPGNDSTKETGDIAVFGSKAFESKATLAGSRSIAGLRFEAMINDDKWMISRGSGADHTLRLGSNGIQIPQGDTEVIIDCNIGLQGNQRWILAGENSVLNVEGDVSGPSRLFILGRGSVGFSAALDIGGLAVSGATVETRNIVDAPAMEIVLGDSATLKISGEGLTAGTLAVKSSARILLDPSVKTVRFAGSSGKPWEKGELVIEGFQPGKMNIYFGDTVKALTPEQLGRIRLKNSGAGSSLFLSAQGELQTR